MSQPLWPRGLPIAVIDTTLFSRLVELDIAELLPWLFKQILIPPEVKREAYRAPGRRRLRNLIREMSDFFVSCYECNEFTKEFMKADFGEGEAAAVAQAELKKAIVLIDERKGARYALNLELTVIGTANILNMLKKAGAISEVKSYYDKLDKTGFYLKKEARKQLLAEVGES